MKDAIRLRNQCWIGLALLHREQPQRISFRAQEILQRIRAEQLTPELRAGIQPHIYQHNVANVAPSSAKHRLFYRLADGTFRLFRPADDFHPARSGKTRPEKWELPPLYQELLEWYEQEYCQQPGPSGEELDPVLAMCGVGKEVWAGIDSDAFVRELREGWTSTTESLIPAERRPKPAAGVGKHRLPKRRSHR